MENFTHELEKLWEQMRSTLIKKVEAIGVDSTVGFKTIKLNTKEFHCDTDLGHSGGVLTEVGIDGIFDNDGYSYGYGCLNHEQLAEIVDYINQIFEIEYQNERSILNGEKFLVRKIDGHYFISDGKNHLGGGKLLGKHCKLVTAEK